MNLLAFDIEATGLNPYEDRILELAVVRVSDDTLVFHAFFNAGMSIPPESTAIHGISDESVAGCPPFAACAEAVQALVDGAVLVGFVSRRYDTLMLDTELRRAGQKGLDLLTVKEIDLYRVWKESEPRDLETAVRRFLGRKHELAHQAVPDTAVLPPLLREIARVFGYTTDDMISLSRPDWEVDRSGRLRLDRESGEVVFNFGRHRGQPVRLNDEYLEWMLGAGFPPDTKAAIKLLRRNGFQWSLDAATVA
ncbi:MAG: 3'-5' exonuclease [Gemmatimonadota bacterium]|nr:3'-5' exonuclease [Gemmatimonadota bacterium]MDH3427725.1 3'-5' exonuclease [Gemmatimonadota bacterium]